MLFPLNYMYAEHLTHSVILKYIILYSLQPMVDSDANSNF